MLMWNFIYVQQYYFPSHLNYHHIRGITILCSRNDIQLAGFIEQHPTHTHQEDVNEYNEIINISCSARFLPS